MLSYNIIIHHPDPLPPTIVQLRRPFPLRDLHSRCSHHGDGCCRGSGRPVVARHPTRSAAAPPLPLLPSPTATADRHRRVVGVTYEMLLNHLLNRSKITLHLESTLKSTPSKLNGFWHHTPHTPMIVKYRRRQARRGYRHSQRGHDHIQPWSVSPNLLGEAAPRLGHSRQPRRRTDGAPPLDPDGPRLSAIAYINR